MQGNPRILTDVHLLFDCSGRAVLGRAFWWQESGGVVVRQSKGSLMVVAINFRTGLARLVSGSVDGVGLRDRKKSPPSFCTLCQSRTFPTYPVHPTHFPGVPLILSIKQLSPSRVPVSPHLFHRCKASCLPTHRQVAAALPILQFPLHTQAPHNSMAPSLLLDSESPPPSFVLHAKQAFMPDGGVSLKEAQAPVGGEFSFGSTAMNGNGNGNGNGAVSGNGFSDVQRSGEEFLNTETLREQSQSYASQPQHQGDRKRPNILYIMADQMAAPMLKFNDPESVIKTPHLDELARTGVNFSSAYCNSPLCAPSRFTMCSGQLPSKIGGYDNASILGPEVPTYAHYLRREGYETALAGKMHFIGPDQLHGFEHRLTSDIYPGDLGWSVNWDKPEDRQEWYHNMSSVMQAGPCVRSNQLDYDEDVMHKVNTFL